MERFPGNPILKPVEEHAWESRQVFNATAIYLDSKVHLLYRAIGNDNISRLGYATSADGFTIDERLPDPIFKPATDSEKDGCEDPRLSEVEGQLVMTYTALREYRHLQFYQIALTSIAKEDFVQKNWNWGTRKLPFQVSAIKMLLFFLKGLTADTLCFTALNLTSASLTQMI